MVNLCNDVPECIELARACAHINAYAHEYQSGLSSEAASGEGVAPLIKFPRLQPDKARVLLVCTPEGKVSPSHKAHFTHLR